MKTKQQELEEEFKELVHSCRYFLTKLGLTEGTEAWEKALREWSTSEMDYKRVSEAVRELRAKGL